MILDIEPKHGIIHDFLLDFDLGYGSNPNVFLKFHNHI